MDSLYDDPVLYDLLFTPDPFLSFYRNLAQSQNGSVLELGCGSGQILTPIAELGFHCVGIDLHPAMLAAAEQRGATSRKRPSFMETDMRDFALAEHFSLVFIARNSLLHLHTHDDFVRCFRCIHRHLDQGGLLAIDIFNPAISILASSPEERQPVARVMHPDKGWVSVEAISDYDSRTQVNRATWFASSESAPDYLVAPLHLRCVFSEERVLLLEMVGFTLEARFGDFERSPFDSSSARQICLCRAA